jgi:hypothetical protein
LASAPLTDVSCVSAQSQANKQREGKENKRKSEKWENKNVPKPKKERTDAGYVLLEVVDLGAQEAQRLGLGRGLLLQPRDLLLQRSQTPRTIFT